MLHSAGYSVRWAVDIDAFVIEYDHSFVLYMSENALRYAKFDVVETVNAAARERGIEI